MQSSGPRSRRETIDAAPPPWSPSLSHNHLIALGITEFFNRLSLSQSQTQRPQSPKLRIRGPSLSSFVYKQRAVYRRRLVYPFTSKRRLHKSVRGLSSPSVFTVLCAEQKKKRSDKPRDFASARFCADARHKTADGIYRYMAGRY